MRRRKTESAGPRLQATHEFEVRFSEVDSMGVVWHGSYPLYLEDAREAFGSRYGLGYMTICDAGYYAPLVEMSVQYHSPIIYGMRCRVDIYYTPTEAAKIVFDYEIRDCATGQLRATAHTVQVFMDKQYRLVWLTPDFYADWKKKNTETTETT